MRRKKPVSLPLSDQLRIAAEQLPASSTLRDILQQSSAALAAAERVDPELEAEVRVIKCAVFWYKAQHVKDGLGRAYRAEGLLDRACAKLYRAQGREPLD